MSEEEEEDEELDDESESEDEEVSVRVDGPDIKGFKRNHLINSKCLDTA